MSHAAVNDGTCAGLATSSVVAELEGREVLAFELENQTGVAIEILEVGATLRRLSLPDREGRVADVVPGLQDVDGYLGEHPHLGGIVGRVANRLAGAACTVAGRRWPLTANEGRNHLHGGARGFDRRLWRGRVDDASEHPRVVFSRTAAHLEEGYPGELEVEVAFTLEASALDLSMTARCDRPTVVNLTHHGYWNLGGHDDGPVWGHRLRIGADHRLEVDGEMIPTGRFLAVEGTALDFRDDRELAERAYDHTFVPHGAGLRRVARLWHPESGRALVVETDRASLQVYVSGTPAHGRRGKGGTEYGPSYAIALEAQCYPDSPSHRDWPSIALAPGAVYGHRTRYLFGLADRHGECLDLEGNPR